MQFMFSVLLWQISNWTLHVTKIKEPKLLTQRGNLTDIFFEKMLCTLIYLIYITNVLYSSCDMYLSFNNIQFFHFFSDDRCVYDGRDPFNQNFWKFRSKTQWIGSVQAEKFRKNWSTFWGGSVFMVRLVWILLEWITPNISLQSSNE